MINEFSLIKEIKKWLSQNNLTVPIGDDAAAFNLESDKQTLLTTDSLVEDVHFKLDTITPKTLGFKALTVNVSDIAAMGGRPKYAALALSLPAKINLKFIKEFYKGLNDAATKYGLTIAGGDLTSARELVINISLIGQVDKKMLLKRSSAKIEELILVTGTLGGSAGGLKLALSGHTLGSAKAKHKRHANYLLNKHFKPQARVEQAQKAAEIGIKTAIDISDGLVSDCQRICEASKVGCRLNAKDIPIDDQLTEGDLPKIDPLQMALSGGEDYELIFSAPKNKANELIGAFKRKNWPITVIGEITSKGIDVVDEHGKKIKWSKGYEHF